MWKPRKSARARSLSELHADLAAIPAERAKLELALEEIEHALPDLLVDDPEQSVAALAEKARLQGELAGIPAREAALVARVAEIEDEADKKAKADARVAVEKEAAKFAPLVLEIEADGRKLKEKLDRLEQHRDRAKAAGVEDAEASVRRGPSRIVPAITETKLVWFDAEGRRFGSNFTTDREGRQVKAPDRVQREVVDTIREEYVEPGAMPERFADAIRLVDLKGRPL